MRLWDYRLLKVLPDQFLVRSMARMYCNKKAMGERNIET